VLRDAGLSGQDRGSRRESPACARRDGICPDSSLRSGCGKMSVLKRRSDPPWAGPVTTNRSPEPVSPRLTQ
jgi:hypothetical protein